MRETVSTHRAGLLSRNGHQQRSLSIPNGSHASPYHYQYPRKSPKVNGNFEGKNGGTCLCVVFRMMTFPQGMDNVKGQVRLVAQNIYQPCLTAVRKMFKDH
ncbi:hypothetical protein OIU84_018678 [Salix udensis]|uniref:Uncharacterized protein n=1 Tax=Salix udensis TaxID=889485 RepID=A0AAD6PIQ2_9ROSI|nr:hypothetical protein OIU84_018678 [Salix udensis]